MLTVIDVKFIFDSACLSVSFGDKEVFQFCKYSPCFRRYPSSCLLAVLAMFLANSFPIVMPFCIHYQINSSPSLGLLS